MSATWGRRAYHTLNIKEGSLLTLTLDIQVSYVGDEGLQDVPVSSLSTEMESSVPPAVSAFDLSSLLQKSGDSLIILS